MPYFNNCRIAGILGNNNSKILFTIPTYMYNSNGSGIDLSTNSLFYSAGVSGQSGSSVDMHFVKYGVQVKSSQVTINNAQLKNCTYSFSAFDRSTFNLDRGVISGSYDSNTSAYGIYSDSLCVGTAYGLSLTGFPSGTGGQTSASIKNTNGSILFLSTTSDANLVNTVGSNLPSVALVDPSNGAYRYTRATPTDDDYTPPDIGG